MGLSKLVENAHEVRVVDNVVGRRHEHLDEILDLPALELSDALLEDLEELDSLDLAGVECVSLTELAFQVYTLH